MPRVVRPAAVLRHRRQADLQPADPQPGVVGEGDPAAFGGDEGAVVAGLPDPGVLVGGLLAGAEAAPDVGGVKVAKVTGMRRVRRGIADTVRGTTHLTLMGRRLCL